MNADEIIQKVMNEFEILDLGVHANNFERTIATGQILTALCKVGQEAGYQTCARRNIVDSNHITWGEWLWDVIWLQSTDRWDYLISVPLVAESELEPNWSEICEDFPKLLVARSLVRVMVCDGNVLDSNSDNRLKSEEIARKIGDEWVSQFEGTREGDTYLVVTIQWHQQNGEWYFRYFKIIGKDSGDPTITELNT